MTELIDITKDMIVLPAGCLSVDMECPSVTPPAVVTIEDEDHSLSTDEEVIILEYCSDGTEDVHELVEPLSPPYDEARTEDVHELAEPLSPPYDEARRREELRLEFETLPEHMVWTNKDKEEFEAECKAIMQFAQSKAGQIHMHIICKGIVECKRYQDWTNGLIFTEDETMGPFTNFEKLSFEFYLFLSTFLEKFKYKYCDNRKFIYGVLMPQLIIEGFIRMRESKGIQFSKKEAEERLKYTTNRFKRNGDS
ncbi:hypothetical protein FOCC_FOCC009464 [Frankliniella occidentalis]|nr:hypothetical protein FOCC_FOCC009464 [Frankliniella occidentalis]